SFKRVDHIAQALTHLVTVFVQYKTISDNRFIGYTGIFIFRNFNTCFLKLFMYTFLQQGTQGVQGIKPATRLVYAFRDEIGGVVLRESFLVFKREMPLRIRHGAGVKPYIYKVRLAVHRFVIIIYQYDI